MKDHSTIIPRLSQYQNLTVNVTILITRYDFKISLTTVFLCNPFVAAGYINKVATTIQQFMANGMQCTCTKSSLSTAEYVHVHVYIQKDTI